MCFGSQRCRLDGVRLYSRFVGVLGLGVRLLVHVRVLAFCGRRFLRVTQHVLLFLVVVVVEVAVLVPPLYNVVTIGDVAVAVAIANSIPRRLSQLLLFFGPFFLEQSITWCSSTCPPMVCARSWRLICSLNLEVSLFERLERAGYPVHMLTVQYRMHPEIRAFPSGGFVHQAI